MLAAKAPDRPRRDRGARRGERDHPQPAAPSAGDRVELGLGVVQPREDHIGMGDERRAGFGEAHATREALDEHRARLALQRGDLLGDRRLRVRSDSAAAENEPRAATSLRTFNRFTSSISSPYRSYAQMSFVLMASRWESR